MTLRTTGRFSLAILGILAILLSPWAPFSERSSSAEADQTSAVLVPTDPIPDTAIVVCHDCETNDLQAAITAAPDGAVIAVQAGTWPSITISHPVRVVGVDWPIIDAQGEGSAILIESDDVAVEGFDIRNTGRSYDKENSGVYFEGQRVQVLNNRLSHSLFGINGATAHDSVIAGNFVEGETEVSEGLRGDGIKVWYSHRVQIHHNTVINSRDLLVWYSDNCDVYENRVSHSRYGFHFMNSNEGRAARNSLVGNSTGIYIMYGKNFKVEDNLLESSRGPSGQGIGLKEVDGFTVSGNVIYNNRIGVYNDNSPYSNNTVGVFRNNLFAYNDVGVGVMPSARENVYSENSFVENLEQVNVLGGGKLGEGNVWSENGRGNFWSDYVGYDADGDGIGDVPYRSTVVSEQLRRTRPELQLFRFSLAESALDFAVEALPMFQITAVMEDEYPLISPYVPTNAPAVTQDVSPVRSGTIAGTLIVGVAASAWWAVRPAREASKRKEVS